MSYLVIWIYADNKLGSVTHLATLDEVKQKMADIADDPEYDPTRESIHYCQLPEMGRDNDEINFTAWEGTP